MGGDFLPSRVVEKPEELGLLAIAQFEQLRGGHNVGPVAEQAGIE